MEIGAGEKGAPVHLYGQEKITAEKLMATEAFNIIASDKISMHRTVPGKISYAFQLIFTLIQGIETQK